MGDALLAVAVLVLILGVATVLGKDNNE